MTIQVKTLLFLTLFAAPTLFCQQTDSVKLSEFERVEVDASYPGGNTGWRQFLEKNLDAGVPERKGAPLGDYTVIVQFIVDKDGTVTDVTPLTKLGYGMEEELIRLIKKSGKWMPASQNGRTVKAFRQQPVTFRVQRDDIRVWNKFRNVLFEQSENEINITVDKVKPLSLELRISQGTISMIAEGKYRIVGVKPGRAVIHLRDGKKNRDIADISLAVESGSAPAL